MVPGACVVLEDVHVPFACSAAWCVNFTFRTSRVCGVFRQFLAVAVGCRVPLGVRADGNGGDGCTRRHRNYGGVYARECGYKATCDR